MDTLFSTEDAAKLAGLKYKTFHERSRKAGIKPAKFEIPARGGKPRPRWTPAQVEQIKNLCGDKRTVATDNSNDNCDEKITAAHHDTEEQKCRKCRTTYFAPSYKTRLV